MRRNIEKSEREVKGRMARVMVDYADMAEEFEKEIREDR